MGKLRFISYIGNTAILCLFFLIVTKGIVDIANGPDLQGSQATTFWPFDVWTVLGLLPMLQGSLASHYNGPVFYDTLKNKGSWWATVAAAQLGIGALYAVFTGLAAYSFGYDAGMDSMCLNRVLEFGRLEADKSHAWHYVALACIVLMTLSIMGTFSIVFPSSRNFVLQLLEDNSIIQKATKDGSWWYHTTTRRRIMTVAGIAIVTGIAMTPMDTSFPFKLTSATVGVLLILCCLCGSTGPQRERTKQGLTR